MIAHLGIKVIDPTVDGLSEADRLSEEVRRLADDPSQKVAAIKLFREQTGVGLREAKEAVEA